jgi:hypothetical protein
LSTRIRSQPSKRPKRLAPIRSERFNTVAGTSTRSREASSIRTAYPFRFGLRRDPRHRASASPRATPEALREKLKPAFGYIRQVTCNPNCQRAPEASSRLLQPYGCSELSRFTAPSPLRRTNAATLRGVIFHSKQIVRFASEVPALPARATAPCGTVVALARRSTTPPASRERRRLRSHEPLLPTRSETPFGSAHRFTRYGPHDA